MNVATRPPRTSRLTAPLQKSSSTPLTCFQARSSYYTNSREHLCDLSTRACTPHRFYRGGSFSQMYSDYILFLHTRPQAGAGARRAGLRGRNPRTQLWTQGLQAGPQQGPHAARLRALLTARRSAVHATSREACTRSGNGSHPCVSLRVPAVHPPFSRQCTQPASIHGEAAPPTARHSRCTAVCNSHTRLAPTQAGSRGKSTAGCRSCAR